jgi:hypothetical protein
MIFKHFTQRQVLIEVRRLGEKNSSKNTRLEGKKSKQKREYQKGVRLFAQADEMILRPTGAEFTLIKSSCCAATFVTRSSYKHPQSVHSSGQ